MRETDLRERHSDDARMCLLNCIFNYDYVEINFNMPINILQTFSGSYNFIQIMQNKMINVYFQERV